MPNILSLLLILIFHVLIMKIDPCQDLFFLLSVLFNFKKLFLSLPFICKSVFTWMFIFLPCACLVNLEAKRGGWDP